MLRQSILVGFGVSTLLTIPVHASSGGQESAVGAGAEEITLRLLYQLITILVATRVVTWLVRRLGQTDVSGEILAGLLLGPSLLGALFPEFMHGLFHPSTSTIFTGLAQVGLIFLMFQIGLEFEFNRHLGGDHRSVVVISLMGIAIPFVMGYFSAPWFHARLSEAVPLFGFQLFFAVAMSITAIPILGRIFMELGLSHTRTAALTIGAAAIDDVAGWLLLGGVTLIVRHQCAPPATWRAEPRRGRVDSPRPVRFRSTDLSHRRVRDHRRIRRRGGPA